MKISLATGQRLSQNAYAAISLLNYNNIEIARYVNEVLEANPLLEGLEGRENADEESFEKTKDRFEWLAVTDEQNKDFYKSDYEPDERGEIFEIAEIKPETLQDALYEQLYTLKLSDAQAELCEYIIESLNASGWFDGDIKDVCKRFGVSKSDVDLALKTLQSFEPYGVCARNLTDCLLIQLRKLNNKNRLAEKIVKSDLNCIGRRKIKELALKYGEAESEVIKAIDIISGLNPRPSSGYAVKGGANYIVPDVTVSVIKGEFEVSLNDANIPTLRINPEYAKLLSSESDEIKNYVHKKLKQAEWTIKNIEARRQTIYRIAGAVVEFQRDFFISGGGLKPLTLREISSVLNVHESTVSRAVKNKYIGCARGCFPLAYFFDNKIAGGAEEFLSSQYVKGELKRIIENEDKSNPYSDGRLAELLNDIRITIKRRTVAKYRAELGFAPASLRRGHKTPKEPYPKSR